MASVVKESKVLSLDKEVLASKVYECLVKRPINIFDEDIKQFRVNDKWQLVSLRAVGNNLEDSRDIGSGNMVTAYNFISNKVLYSEDKSISSEQLFSELLEILVQKRLIRKNPELVRKTFKVV